MVGEYPVLIDHSLPGGERPDPVPVESCGRSCRRNPRLTTRFEDLSAALPAHAEGVYCAMAAVGLLIGHQFWLGREDFAERFVEMHASAVGGTPMALLDRESGRAGAGARGGWRARTRRGRVLRAAASIC